jgi:hypothetical protein
MRLRFLLLAYAREYPRLWIRAYTRLDARITALMQPAWVIWIRVLSPRVCRALARLISGYLLPTAAAAPVILTTTSLIPLWAAVIAAYAAGLSAEKLLGIGLRQNATTRPRDGGRRPARAGAETRS